MGARHARDSRRAAAKTDVAEVGDVEHVGVHSGVTRELTVVLCSVGDFVPTSVGVVPDCTFTTGVHTGVNVPLFAAGVGAELVTGVLDNTDVFALIAGIGP